MTQETQERAAFEALLLLRDAIVFQRVGASDEATMSRALEAANAVIAARADRESSAMPELTMRDVVWRLERIAGNTDTDPRWKAAEAIRALPGWESFAVYAGASPPPKSLKVCKYGDATCPCQDGDPCHYEGKDAWPRPAPPPESADVRDAARLDWIEKHWFYEHAERLHFSFNETWSTASLSLRQSIDGAIAAAAREPKGDA